MIQQVIVVEGKSDIARVRQAVDADAFYGSGSLTHRMRDILK